MLRFHEKLSAMSKRQPLAVNVIIKEEIINFKEEMRS